MDKSSFYKKAEEFLANVWAEIQGSNFELKPHWDIDHICYRVDSVESYEEMKAFLGAFSSLLVESPVGGRLIATYELNEPLKFNDYLIYLVELPQPKAGRNEREGFEHIEIVVDEKLSDIVNTSPSLAWGTKGLAKDYNPELKLSLESTNIKLHNQSLKSVVNLEKNELVFSAIQELGILLSYKEFYPLIAGTFPLGVNTDSSDVDVLLHSSDLDGLSKSFERDFSSYEDFELKRKVKRDKDSLICKFKFQKVEFELFAQDTITPQNIAFQHYLVEEKLLKYKGSTFFHKVRNLRRQEGLKTEPAFARVLGLAGDPYIELLNLNKVALGKLV